MSGLTPTVRLNGDGTHRPASHPVVQRDAWRRRIEQIIASFEGQLYSATDVLTVITHLVQQLPNATKDAEQRQTCARLAAELHRRGRVPRQITGEAYYRNPGSPETERRYAAITAAARDGRPLQEIADEFGVSKQLVSRVAIARGVRRRHRRPA